MIITIIITIIIAIVIVILIAAQVIEKVIIIRSSLNLTENYEGIKSYF
mgnify:CR=1 FL=1